MSVFDQFQARAVEWCDRNPRGWIAMEQGLGKSRVFVLAAKLPALVVCPAHLQQNWLDEIEKWQNGARVQRVKTGTGYDGRSDFYVQSWDIAHSMVPPIQVRSVALDEAQYARSPKSRRTKAITRNYIRTVENSWFLSGTPLSRPCELWALAHAIGMTRMTYREWGFHYCAGKVGYWGGMDFRGVSNADELAELFAKYAFRLTKDEVGGLPDKNRRLVVIDSINDIRERAYEVGSLLRNPHPVAFVGLAELLHEHGRRKVKAACTHIEHILQTERPILVGVKHLDVAAGIEEWCKKEGLKVATITGDTPSITRLAMQRAFQAGTLDVLIGNAAIREGLTLTAARYGIMVEADWSYNNNVQMEDRLHRIGQGLPVQWDYLVADRSVDAAIVKATMFKKETAERILGDDWRRTLKELCHG